MTRRDSKNPYQSPATPIERDFVSPEDTAIRWRFLTFVSVILTFLIVPIEIEIPFMFRQQSIEVIILARIVCWAVILTPLLSYCLLNGWRGIKIAKWRILLIGVVFLLTH